MSFLKQQRKAEEAGNGDQLHWDRAAQDGAPFRGDIPLLKDAEFESLTERVYDSKSGIFNTSTPEQRCSGRTYQEVMDGVLAGWFKLMSDRQYKWLDTGAEPEMMVYIEWAEPYQELSARAREKLQAQG